MVASSSACHHHHRLRNSSSSSNRSSSSSSSSSMTKSPKRYVSSRMRRTTTTTRMRMISAASRPSLAVVIVGTAILQTRTNIHSISPYNHREIKLGNAKLQQSEPSHLRATLMVRTIQAFSRVIQTPGIFIFSIFLKSVGSHWKIVPFLSVHLLFRGRFSMRCTVTSARRQGGF